MRATPESPRMFESDFLDFFSRVPFWVVPLIYVPVVASYLLAGSQAGVSDAGLVGQFVAGYLVWTLLEYWLHRTLFHWIPAASWGERFHFFLHGVHHRWFQDKYRLVMPPAASIAVAVVVNAILFAIAAVTAPWLAPTWVWGLFAGIAFGYMVYDLTHYYIHHQKPRTFIGRALRSHHNKHHHNAKYKDLKFGVSTTLWDHVFGTYEVRE